MQIDPTPADRCNAVREGLITLLPRIRRLARALAGHASDADDLAQIAVERALARSGQWRPDAPLDKWVFAITRNAWRDELRARGRSQQLFAPEEAGTMQADGDSTRPMQQLELAAAMAALSVDHREVIAMVLVEGLTYDETAALLDLPVGTVTSRLARARQMLQAYIGEGE